MRRRAEPSALAPRDLEVRPRGRGEPRQADEGTLAGKRRRETSERSDMHGYRTNLNRLTGLRLSRVMLGCLGLTRRRQGEVGEVEFAALRVRADQVRLLGVEERQSLAARPVRVDAHPGTIRSALTSLLSSLFLPLFAFLFLTLSLSLSLFLTLRVSRFPRTDCPRLARTELANRELLLATHTLSQA